MTAVKRFPASSAQNPYSLAKMALWMKMKANKVSVIFIRSAIL